MKLLIFLLTCLFYSSYHQKTSSVQKFQVIHEWAFINFTWPSSSGYKNAINKQKYIPENVAMAGIKVYKDNIYIAMPQIRTGVPVTLGVIPIEAVPKNPLITPFPSWEMNVKRDCNSLQSVQSMEIDRNGVIWIINGVRINNNTNCPPKLVLIDLESEKTEHVYEFPNEICLTNGGFLNDIVIDDSNGVFAYITDHSSIDPGLIVYSKSKDRAWKLRDKTMFAELNAINFLVDGLATTQLAPIDGIALSPKNSKERFIYYCSLVGYNLYSLSTGIAQDEDKIRSGSWRKSVVLLGKKQSQSDGMMMDNKGNLYYTLLPLYGVGKWNVGESFNKADILERNRTDIVWPDSFGFDDRGYLYLLANNINKYFNPTYMLQITSEAKFRIFKYYTNTKSYLF